MKALNFLIFILLISISSARAETYYGLSMHGKPKYDNDFSHIDYVNPDAPKGGVVKMLALGSFDSLNPFAIKGKAAEGLNLVYDRLMRRVWDEAFTLYPLIAEKVEIPDDRSSIKIFINPKARFSDNSEITSSDVVFSFETLKENGRPNMRRVYKLVKNVNIISDLIVEFELGEGFDRETVMILAMMPVLSKKWWEGKKFDSSILKTPVTTGPYKVSEVDPGRRIIFERDPNYWAADLPVNKGHFNFDKVIYDYYLDDSVAFEAFKSGEYDIRREMDANKWASAYDFPLLKRNEVEKKTFNHQRPERVNALIFNTRRSPFDNRLVRQALTNVLNFEWLNENIFYGQYKRIDSYFPNSELAAKGRPSQKELEVLNEWRQNIPENVFLNTYKPPVHLDARSTRKLLKEADQLLKEAGYVIDGGKRVNPNGERLSFEILIYTKADEKIALSYISSLKKLGIDATLRVLDDAAFRGRLNEYDFDMTIYYWQNSLSPGTEQMLYWSCESAEQFSRWNYPGICNPAIDEIAAKIATVKDRDELVSLTQSLDRLLTWGYYIIPLYYAGYDKIAFKSFVKHPNKTPIYGVVFETWWAEN
jgi:ABC-type oligopeptide transport system substrate-binding subunit